MEAKTKNFLPRFGSFVITIGTIMEAVINNIFIEHFTEDAKFVTRIYFRQA